MRKPLLPCLLAITVATDSSAGSRWVETTGQVPTTCAASSAGGDGLALSEVTACRATARAVDGGAINGGKLVPYYCEVGASSATGWHEGPSTSVCLLTTSDKVDGGNGRQMQLCEWTVPNAFGRIAVAAYGLTGADGGTANGYIGLADAGLSQTVLPVVRLECNVPGANTPAGGTP